MERSKDEECRRKAQKLTTSSTYVDSILASDWRGSHPMFQDQDTITSTTIFFFSLNKETFIFSDPANEQFIREIYALLLKSFSIKVFRFFLERIYHVER